jgi:fucose permease
MVDNITQQLADIVSATRELDADCYAQRIHSYLMFSEPQMSFMQRYNVKRSVMLAALVCAVCYLGAVVQACVRRQRQRMENE